MPRDADATRRRILDAALEEFAEKGLAGARVDAIAERAGTSPRLLYVHFGGKDQLYEKVLGEHVGRRASALAGGPRPLVEFAVRHFASLLGDEVFVRLIVWEALATGPDDVPVGLPARTHRYAEMVQYLRSEQETGRLDRSLDPEMVLLVIIAMASFPVVFQQVVRLVTGADPADPGFVGRYEEMIRQVARRLGPVPGTSAAMD